MSRKKEKEKDDSSLIVLTYQKNYRMVVSAYPANACLPGLLSLLA